MVKRRRQKTGIRSRARSGNNKGKPDARKGEDDDDDEGVGVADKNNCLTDLKENPASVKINNRRKEPQSVVDSNINVEQDKHQENESGKERKFQREENKKVVLSKNTESGTCPVSTVSTESKTDTTVIGSSDDRKEKLCQSDTSDHGKSKSTVSDIGIATEGNPMQGQSFIPKVSHLNYIDIEDDACDREVREITNSGQGTKGKIKSAVAKMSPRTPLQILKMSDAPHQISRAAKSPVMKKNNVSQLTLLSSDGILTSECTNCEKLRQVSCI